VCVCVCTYKRYDARVFFFSLLLNVSTVSVYIFYGGFRSDRSDLKMLLLLLL